MLRSGGRTSFSVSGRMKDRPYSTSLMLLTSAKVIIKFEYTMKHRPLYVRRKCNQNIMGKDVGFCMVSKRQVATYG